jgi:hypothetical protein
LPLRPHIRAAFHWSEGEPIGWRTVAIAALGMAVPAALGLAAGRPALGFTIGLGAMLLAGEAPPSGGAVQDRPSPGSAVFPAILAVTIATLIAGAPWADAAMIGLAGVAAAISGYSRPVGVAAIRFIIYLVLSVILLDSAGDHREWAALAFGLGALWNVAVRLVLARDKKKLAGAPPSRMPTPAQRRAHWRKTMRGLSGWQFPIRLVAGLAVASTLRHLWPSHHYGWIVLTVALLTQRPIEPLPVKTSQRTLGAVIGVGATWTILMWAPPPAILGVLICALATLAAVGRAGNYLVYAAASTPVILLVFDLGKPVAPALLTDRLVATLLGAAIVVAANFALDRLSAPSRKT